MIDEKQLTQLHQAFKRIFAMPISRSTFREIQNAILAVTGSASNESNQLFESLVTGNDNTAKDVCGQSETFRKLVEEYSISIRVAKDVFERGEFISLASSDIITQPNRIAFLNRVRRVDGQEMHFLTDTKGTINLLQHLVGRLIEVQNNDAGKESLKNCKEDIRSVKEKLEQLINS